jgi:hypothetical protein
VRRDLIIYDNRNPAFASGGVADGQWNQTAKALRSAMVSTAHRAPPHPKDLEHGHLLVGYFSSLTSRPFPRIFEKAQEEITIATDTAFSVNESTAHYVEPA